MTRSMKLRGAAILATVGLLGGAALVASGATGAFFSDTAAGSVSGSIGSVHESTTDLNLSFNNLLPGVPQTVQATFANDTGTGNEDFYLTFPNATALSALNNLGMYGTIHISSSGEGAVGDVFDSNNLDDSSVSCGPFGQGNTVVNGVTQPLCWPLPNQLKIASNVPPGYNGTVYITFNYASALKYGLNGPTGGGVFNTYPVAPVADPTGHNGQVTIVPSDGSGSGLPFDIVATQVGVTPGDPGTKP